MPAIPEFQRRRLASSVVGTPGVSLAGAALGEAVAGFGAGLSEGLFKRAEAARNVAEIAESSARASELTNVIRELRKESIANGESQSVFNAKASTFRDDFSEGMSGRTRARFFTETKRLMTREGDRFARDFEVKQLSDAESNFTKNIEVRAKPIYDSFREGNLIEGGELLDNAISENGIAFAATKDALPPGSKIADFSKEGKVAFIRAAYQGLLDSEDPKQAAVFLDSPFARENLSLAEREEVIKRANRLSFSKLQRAKITKLTIQQETAADIHQRILDGETVTEEELVRKENNGTLTRKEANAARNTRDQTNFARVDDPATYKLLLDSYERLDLAAREIERIGQTPVDNDFDFLERSIRLKADIQDAVKEGKLTRESASEWINATTVGASKSIGDILEDVATAKVIRKAWDLTSPIPFIAEVDVPEGLSFFTKAAAKTKLLASILEEVRSRSSAKNPLPKSEVSKIIRQKAAELNAIVNFDSMAFKSGDIRRTADGTFIEALGPDSEGKMMWLPTTDPKAPKEDPLEVPLIRPIDIPRAVSEMTR